MSHRLRLPTLTLLLALSAPIGAQQADERLAAQPEPVRPLNLSLPRDAVWPSPVRPELSVGERVSRDSGALPDFSADTGRRDRQPYGTGYEARQRGGGGGRGMGRGR